PGPENCRVRDRKLLCGFHCPTCFHYTGCKHLRLKPAVLVLYLNPCSSHSCLSAKKWIYKAYCSFKGFPRQGVDAEFDLVPFIYSSKLAFIKIKQNPYPGKIGYLVKWHSTLYIITQVHHFFCYYSCNICCNRKSLDRRIVG